MSRQKKKKVLKKAVLSYSRLLHVYSSTLLFSLLILFSLTGITLNHRWYDSNNNQEMQLQHSITDKQLTKWLPINGFEPSGNMITEPVSEQSFGGPSSSRKISQWNPDLTQITYDIRKDFSLPAPSSIDLEQEFKEVVLDFKVPAGFATVTLSFENLTLILEQEKGSFLGVLNDLHKGRHSGEAWSWLIDLSAGLMIFFSVTGLILLFQGKKYRRGGVVSFLLGTLTPYLIYLFFVPLIGS